MKKWEELILDILEDDAFAKAAFLQLQSGFLRYDTKENIETVAEILKKQYMSVDVESIFANKEKEEIIDFLNRLIVSKLANRNYHKSQEDLIALEELDEFIQSAEQTDNISKEELSKSGMVLTTRSYLDMCRIVYDAIAEWKYPSDISTAYLFCEARMFDYKHEYDYGILGVDWDSAEQFACRFNNSYHKEEMRFGGPKLYIHDESSRVGKNAYEFPKTYSHWTGYVCCCTYDIREAYQAIKMYNALRKKKYPIYFHNYKKAYLTAKSSLN